ncbi:MAG: PilZ domain-containing protein [Candidatus Omnitrophota bacterium]|jgi:hypothetical protein|nr:MAG: PilZ domain-containing protein [Candidatus Omnitrophota bacterium]
MYWKKRTVAKPTKTLKKEPLSLLKPSPRPHLPRDKRIDLQLPCYLLVEKTGHFLQTTTINLSKSGILVRSLKPLETGQEVLCLLSNRTNLTKLDVMHGKHTMKAKVVRVERQEVLFRMALQVTLGRVNPVSFLEFDGENKYWWSRHWQ